MTDDRERVEQLRREQEEANMPLSDRMQQFVEGVQSRICQALEDVEEEGHFSADRWEHEQGGGGLTRVLEEGAVFEKAGVNTSTVYGDLPDRMAQALNVEPLPFFVTGVSLVVHPRSPYVPAVHANFRYFALGPDRDDPVDQWFGGGADLTPHYPYLEDAKHFHRVWKEVCDRHPEAADYDAFRRQCDEYFYVAHREEARGIGGIFFDYLRDSPEATYRFVREAGGAFLRSYLPIVQRRRGQSYGERERRFQEVRRGRYVEFNLVYDRGTKFGLETQGRIESILMSLPPVVRWRYDWTPEPGSPEERAQWFFKARNWLELDSDDIPPAEGERELGNR